MSEHMQTSVNNTTSSPPGGTSANSANAVSRPNRPRREKVLIALLLIVAAFAFLPAPDPSSLTFWCVRPGMPRWLVERILGRPGNFTSQRERYADGNVWQGIRNPAPGASDVSQWTTDTVVGAVFYDANAHVIDVIYRVREGDERRRHPVAPNFRGD